MHQLLMVLLFLNVSVLTWNVVLAPDTKTFSPVLIDPSIPALELRKDVDEVVYRSASAGTQSSCYTIGPYNSEKAAELVASKVRGFGLAVTIRHGQSMETLNFFVYISMSNKHTDYNLICWSFCRYAGKNIKFLKE